MRKNTGYTELDKRDESDEKTVISNALLVNFYGV